MKATYQRNDSREGKVFDLKLLPAPVRGTFLCMESTHETLKNVLDTLDTSTHELNFLLRKPNIWYSGVSEDVMREIVDSLRSSIHDYSERIRNEKNIVQEKMKNIKDSLQTLTLRSAEKVCSKGNEIQEVSQDSIIHIVSSDDETFSSEKERRRSSQEEKKCVTHMLHNFRSRRLSVVQRLKSIKLKKFHGNKKIKVYSKELGEEKKVRYSTLRNFLYENETYEVVEELDWRKKKRKKKKVISVRETSLPPTPLDLWSLSF